MLYADGLNSHSHSLEEEMVSFLSTTVACPAEGCIGGASLSHFVALVRHHGNMLL